MSRPGTVSGDSVVDESMGARRGSMDGVKPYMLPAEVTDAPPNAIFLDSAWRHQTRGRNLDKGGRRASVSMALAHPGFTVQDPTGAACKCDGDTALLEGRFDDAVAHYSAGLAALGITPQALSLIHI